NFVVCQTGFFDTANHTAKAPLDMGGLAEDKYIFVEGVGTFKIDHGGVATTSADVFGRPNWTVTTTTTTPLDGVPTGYAFVEPDQRSDGYTHMGLLRWIGYTQYAQYFASAAGITGRVAVATGYAAGVLTVTTTAAQHYFRINPASNALRAVN